MISGSRSLVRQVRVAFLGPEYSYTHLAASERFGDSAELVPVSTIATVFEEVNRHEVDFGIVPIENSTDGRVVDTLGMFARMPVRICGEVQLRIHHNLLAMCRQEQIQEVVSKPQAISQCRAWLAKHLPDVRTNEISSTAAAARLAKKKEGTAAIASRQAGVNNGLSVIASKIEDNPDNVTRFAVIGDHSSPRSGNDKTAVMFGLPHKPGTLADVLAIFKSNRLNMTWIESFPLPGTKNEYLFFVELQGHETDLKVRRALDALETLATRLDVLGSFVVTEPVA